MLCAILSCLFLSNLFWLSLPKQMHREQRVSEANTDLLFSLFNGVEEEDAQRRIHLVRRGRPKKPPPVFSRPRMLQVRTRSPVC